MESLPSSGLDAFVAVAEELHFSKAASRLHLSQPALSVRIRQLEEKLGHQLFIRGAGGVQLTEVGHRLLRYCLTKNSLEFEVLSSLSGQGELGGHVTIAGFSSVVRSLVIPALGQLLRRYPLLHVDVRSRELGELTELLSRSSVDFVLSDRRFDRSGIECVLLGREEWVLVESTEHTTTPDVYLDHDANDTTTFRFLRANRQSVKLVRRYYFDEIYAIFDGVAEGIGRAVVSKHLVAAHPRVRIVEGLRHLRAPVYLHYFSQSAYSRAHEAVREVLQQFIRAALA